MDTKRLENIGEIFVINTLLEAGILVSKPLFDQSGGDLIGFTSVDDRARICRIQCKYRELKTRTSVFVDSGYVTGAFVLFLYLKTPEEKYLFCFLPKDIRHHFRKGAQGSKKVFRLTITLETVAALSNEGSVWFTSGKVAELFNLMRRSSPDFEIRRVVKDMVRTSRELENLRKKRDKLQKLIHEIEVTNVKKKATEEKLEILQEYLRYMESQLKGGDRIKRGRS